jgi:dTDP-4-amino-4,6-dideoxygalactose transaminase
MIAASEWMHPESSIDRELPVPNVLLPDLAAALGEVQLDRLDEFVARRHAISQAYLSVAADLGVDVKRPVPNSQGTWWRFLVALPDECDVDAVVESARARGVVFARPVTHAPSEQRGEFPVAEEMRDSLVSVPLYPALSDAEVEHVAATLRASLHEAAVVAR